MGICIRSSPFGCHVNRHCPFTFYRAHYRYWMEEKPSSGLRLTKRWTLVKCADNGVSLRRGYQLTVLNINQSIQFAIPQNTTNNKSKNCRKTSDSLKFIHCRLAYCPRWPESDVNISPDVLSDATAHWLTAQLWLSITLRSGKGDGVSCFAHCASPN